MALQINIDAVGADMSEWLTVMETYFERKVKQMAEFTGGNENIDSDGCFFSTATTGADGFCHWAAKME